GSHHDPTQRAIRTLYGTTFAGGATGYGSIFEITQGGVFTTLYSICSTPGVCNDGALPAGGLLQGTNGIFYGTTSGGGTSGEGTIFSLDTALVPFVSFIRNPAKIGQQFGILGYGLTGTTSVSFNGVAANFKPQSDTLLVATVPSGASTGYVTVTTPGGTLTSNVPFRVIR
ncbi:MAG TPA: choice-of-anchor tandem repeat GloVer-containing protein, partial [Terriglobales bacterium]|nr:choice-of-anchor tandem repeat GloVer-containing protein [Terriglobales bacterium]